MFISSKQRITQLASVAALIALVAHRGTDALPPQLPPASGDEAQDQLRQDGLGSTDLIVYSNTIINDGTRVTLKGPWVAAAYETGFYIRSRNDASIDTSSNRRWDIQGQGIEIIHHHGWTPDTSVLVDSAAIQLARHNPIFMDNEHVRSIRPLVNAAHLEQEDPRKLLEYIYGEARRGNITPLAVFYLTDPDLHRDFRENKAEMLEQLGLEGDDWTVNAMVLEYLWSDSTMLELLTTTGIRFEPSIKSKEGHGIWISHLFGANGMHIIRKEGVWVID